MPFLIFLLLGTLIFGFAFPAFILLVGLFAVVLLAVMIISFFRGGTFRVYTNRPTGQYSNPYGGREPDDEYYERPIGDDVRPNDTQETHDDFSEEGEVIELPSSALRKEEDDK